MSKIKKRKIVGPAVVGNIVEYYDFGLFAVYAHTIGALFFPARADYVQTLWAFGTFALGFFMRPLGGLVFGYIGDKLGRKTSLSISILGMAFCTFIIGIMPTYATLGIWAPILLLTIRLMQGLCVGGEGAGVAIFVLEHTEGYRPGFMGSIVMASNMFGTLLAVFVGIILNYFCQSTECWRYAFIGGGMTGLVGLYLRYHLTETPGFIERKNSHNIIKHPIVQAMKRQWPSVLVVIMLGGLTSAIAYTIRGYLNTFFLEVMKYDTNAALYFTSFALFVMIILLPLCGLLSDKFGHRKFLHLVCVLIMLLIIPFYNMIANPDKNILMVFIGLSGIASLAASICAPAYSYAIKAFEVELRFSGVAVSWNIGLALMGGTTPVISRYLSEMFSVAAPAYYLIAAAGLFMIISLMTTKRRYTNGVLK